MTTFRSDWQPIETAPKDGEMILLGVAGDNDGTMSGWWTGDNWMVPDGVGYFDEFTHWKPLPLPPEP